MQNRLYELRKTKKVSQQQLANILKVSRPTISSYESGTTEPTLESLAKLANYFGVSIDYLLGNSSIPFDINYNSMKTEAGKLRSRISTKLISLSENDLKTIETLVDRMIKN